MKRALQALLISPDPVMRLAIMAEIKQITIREGHRDYTHGPVLIGCQKIPWAVMAEITTVRHTTLNKVTKDEYRADGYRSRKHMLQDLQSYYPDLTMTSAVTVISWNKVSGFWTEIDNVDQYIEDHGLQKEAAAFGIVV